MLTDADAGLKERDLQVYYLDTDSGEVRTLRSKLHSHGEGFEVMLIGKDGGVKQREAHLVTAQSLFDLIDSMPMRQDEKRRR